MAENIYPIEKMSKADKERLLGQKGLMIWFTGLSGSGKSTLAIALEKELHDRNILCTILDGDNIRSGINNNLGFTEADRVENIRRIAEVGKLFVETGIVTLAAFISPSNDIRKMAALYAKARQGLVKNFTGISAPFEVPENPSVSIDTAARPLADSVKILLDAVLPLIKNGNKQEEK